MSRQETHRASNTFLSFPKALPRARKGGLESQSGLKHGPHLWESQAGGPELHQQRHHAATTRDQTLSRRSDCRDFRGPPRPGRQTQGLEEVKHVCNSTGACTVCEGGGPDNDPTALSHPPTPKTPGSIPERKSPCQVLGQLKAARKTARSRARGLSGAATATPDRLACSDRTHPHVAGSADKQAWELRKVKTGHNEMQLCLLSLIRASSAPVQVLLKQPHGVGNQKVLNHFVCFPLFFLPGSHLNPDINKQIRVTWFMLKMHKIKSPPSYQHPHHILGLLTPQKNPVCPSLSASQKRSGKES